MAIEPGTRFGPYEIVAPLGAGGMGEVYRARDTRLERIVAIKVLPAQLARDPEFRARFEREARSISALNHPHICTLHDVGREGDVEYLVMEYLEGEPLSARLARGPIPADEALGYAVQIADALDKAHRFGIVHRDLKPANIFLVKGPTASGPAICKLLDFGLAKIGPAMTSGVIETKLVTSPPGDALTARGSMLGTFQYMSPEQIEGTDADPRSDIWAFGCVLYEMLTGKRAFEGKSQASLIASILERQPAPIAELQPMTPPALGRIVRTCLEKHPDNRFHTAHDLCLHLQWIEEGGSAAGLPAPVVAGRKRTERARYAAVALGAIIVASAGVWTFKPAPAMDALVMRFVTALPEDQRFTRGGRRYITISGTGEAFAYVANQQIYLRRMNEVEAKPIRGTNVDPVDVAFSPDGEWLAFFAPPSLNGPLANCTLFKIAVGGGVPVPLLTNVSNPSGMHWQGDTLVFGSGSDEIRTIPAAGGQAVVILKAAEGENIAQASIVSGGREVLFTAVKERANWEDGLIAVEPVGGGPRRVIVHGGKDGRLSPDGDRVFYIRGSTLFMQPVDPSSLAPAGGAEPVVEGVVSNNTTGSGQYAIASNGTAVFSEGESDGQTLRLVWVDRTGKEELISAEERQYTYPRLSPDDSKIVVDARDDEDDIWIWDTNRKQLVRLTFGPDRDEYPLWSADGRSVFYRSNPNGQPDVFRRAADGAGSVQQLTRSTAPESLMSLLGGPDGRMLVRTQQAGANSYLSILDFQKPDDLKPLFQTPVNQLVGEISPDGRWLAYQSSEGSTEDQVYVRPFPDVDRGRWQVSVDGGSTPLWSRDGRELFFRSPRPNRLNVVRVMATGGGAAFAYGTPSALFDLSPYSPGFFGRSFDVSRDGKRFVMLRRSGAEQDQRIVVVAHWLSEVVRRAERR